jgi:hypothetical protein
MKRLIAAVAVADVTAGLLAPPVAALPIHVPCPDCAAWPLWLQVLLTVVGVVIALAILYLPYRLSRTARTPGRSLLILLGGVFVLTIGLVLLARLAVLVLAG